MQIIFLLAINWYLFFVNHIMDVEYFFLSPYKSWCIVDKHNVGLSISRNIETISLSKDYIIIKAFWFPIYLFNFFFLSYGLSCSSLIRWNHIFIKVMTRIFIKNHVRDFQWNIKKRGGTSNQLVKNTGFAKAFSSSKFHQAFGKFYSMLFLFCSSSMPTNYFHSMSFMNHFGYLHE